MPADLQALCDEKYPVYRVSPKDGAGMCSCGQPRVWRRGNVLHCRADWLPCPVR